MFDPQAKYLPDINPANPGKRIDLLNPSVQEHFPDQLAPYRAFGADLRSDFRGTLFRLPLRTSLQAQSSRLSHQHHSKDEIFDLLCSFLDEAQLSLLFLKNVASIEVLQWESGEIEPLSVWTCSIHNMTKVLSERRGIIPSNVAKSQQAAVKDQKLTFAHTESDYELQIEINANGSSKSDLLTWLVCTSCSGTDERAGRIACDPLNFHLRLVPWVGVAAMLSKNGENAGNVQGRSFCFLPLPSETGLPVHVNGYFELSSNRRDIWRGDDMAGEGKIRAEWNRALLEDVVAPTYARMILRLAKSQLGTNHEWYYHQWPSVESLAEPWASLARRFYAETAKLPVLFSTVDGGRWVSPEQARYLGNDSEFSEDVRAVLLVEEEPVVDVPDFLSKGFVLSKKSICFVSPAWARHFCKTLRNTESLIKNRTRAIRLLQYCLSDLVLGSPLGTDGAEVYQQLVGLPIVPTMDGSLQRFGRKSDKEQLFIGSEEDSKLLLKLGSQIIDLSLPNSVLDHFRSEALQGYTNVKTLSALIISQLVARLLPEGWRGLAEVQWKPDQREHPSRDWVRLMWKYMVTNKAIKAFHGWPLLPTTEGTLCMLSDSESKVIDGLSVLGERLRGLLSRLGCRTLDVEAVGSRESAGSYAQRPTLQGVLGALRAANQGGVDRLCQMLAASATAVDRRELRAFVCQRKWMSKENCSPDDIGLFLRLPIHELYGRTGEEAFQGLDQTKLLAPAGAAAVLLTDQFVVSDADGEVDMYNFCGVRTVKLSQFYVDFVFPRLKALDAKACEGAMVQMLEQLPQLCREDGRFLDRLSNLEFVTTPSGRLARPWELYDPSVTELHELLEGGEFYPSEVFLRPDLLSTLVRLGLQVSLDRLGVIKVAKSISAMQSKDFDVITRRARSLLRFLDSHFAELASERYGLSEAGKYAATSIKSLVKSLIPVTSQSTNASKQDPSKQSPSMDSESFKRELLTTAWVPVMTSAPSPALPWTDDRFPVACPRDVRPKEELWLLSFFMSIADSDVSSPELREFLGWNRVGDKSLIAAQLVKFTSIAGFDQSVEIQEALNATVLKMYNIFQSTIGNEEFSAIKSILSGHAWFWIGDCFVSPDSVAFRCSLNARPLLSEVPAELFSFSKFLRAMGIKETFSAPDFVRALARLAEKFADTNLPPEQLEVAVAMVQYVADDRSASQNAKMFVPDKSSILCPAVDLVYNDAPWMPFNAFDPDEFRFVHSKISIDVGEQVGVRSLRRQLLLRTSDVFNVALQDTEAFGQSESLTGRLRHILELYPDGPQILNELVQNADDARASEVSILVNRQSYPTSSLLSPNLACWQGPAIYFYNNSVFRPQDFINLTKIGQGSKIDCLGKTGKFGLGFNAVYHFTDLPSFVSGEYLVYFDPHTKYLPGATVQHPGLRIKFTRNNILSQFPDQFKPYIMLGCDLKSEYAGTLFRFPLRKQDSAQHSEIKKVPYTAEDVDGLVDSFRRLGPDALLFLKHIRQIKIFEMDESGETSLLYHVAARTDPIDHASRFLTIPTFVEGSPDAPVSKQQFLSTLQKLSADKLPSCDMVLEISKMDPRAGSTSVERWAISSSIGGGRARDMAVHPSISHMRLVPWVGLAVLLTREGAPTTLQNGRSFCFLPLPSETGLPVHVNGYFELSSNRRDIWRGDDMAGEGKIRAEWNRALLEDVVAPTYARMILRLAKSQLGTNHEWYYHQWPSVESLAEPWASLARRFYAETAKLPVLFSTVDGGRWVSPEQARYLGNDSEFSEDVRAVLLVEEEPVVDVPDFLSKGFVLSKKSICFVSPAWARHFCKTLRNTESLIKNRTRAIRLLQYCLSDLVLGSPLGTDGAEVYQQLVGLPIVPTMDGSLQRFGRKSDKEQLFIGSEEDSKLLLKLGSQIIDLSLPNSVLDHFRSEALQGYTNVKTLSALIISQLVARLLPEGWRGLAEVQWKPDQREHPSRDWVRLMWKYMVTNKAIKAFHGWPLLPTTEGTLCMLSDSESKVIDGLSVLGERLRGLLSRLGCRTLDVEAVGSRESAGSYAQRPTLQGVLGALRAANQGGVDRLCQMLAASATAVDRRELRAFVCQRKWMSKENCSPDDIGLFLRLPIHELYGRTGEEAFQGLDQTKLLAPAGAAAVLLTDQFVVSDADGEVDMYNFCGVRTVKLSQFYVDFVFPRLKALDAKACEGAMVQMLEQLPQLCREDGRFLDRLSNLEFVTTPSGRLARPWELYDPSVTELHELLEGGEFYASEVFLRPDLSATLVRLGLQTALDLTGVVRVARSISAGALSSAGDSAELRATAARRGRALLKYVCRHARAIGIEDLAAALAVAAREGASTDGCDPRRDELLSLAWVPVLQTAPDAGLPWHSRPVAVAAPKAVRGPLSQPRTADRQTEPSVGRAWV